ncbi:50S ribosomal protein L24, partial [Methylicorpusculum sp.]|uniref:50S ribosomal protein L24 n=1 Tax=Methylicorpusculum sp. TaxID=2713644 RepID=UPI002ABB0B40
GKQGTVLSIEPKKGKVLVKGIAIATHHAKARKQGDVSGIKKQESFIDASKVMPVCTACQKPCRVGSTVLESGKKARACKRCREIF